MPLSATPLRNAVQRLREGLARHQADPADEELRDGLVHRFEFAYELSHRTLRRYLAEGAASPDEIARMSFADLIRTGNVAGLLQEEWSAWRFFRDLRSRTSHTSDAMTAEEVVRAIPAFLVEADHLCTELPLHRAETADPVTDARSLDLTADHRRLVLDILDACVPAEAEVWVFGSRATGKARRYSDLDLAIDAGQPLEPGKLGELSEAFSESDLPYRVDIVDWRRISPEFRELIASDRQRLARTTPVA